MKPNNFKLTSYLMLVLFLSVTSMLAQKSEPNTVYDVGATINEMTLTIGGVLVVATNDGLVGIKPSESKPIFTFNTFGQLKPEETEFVPDSPYIIVSQGANSKFAGIAKTKRAVIDYMNGDVIFNSENDNWNQIYTCNVILPQNKLIVSGIQKEGDKFEKMTPKVAVYDLASRKLDFSFFLSKPGKVGIAKDYSVTGTPLLLKDFIIVPTAQGLVAKSHAGEDLWENKIKRINWMVADASETEIYGFETTTNGKNTRIHKIGKNGEVLWNDDRKVQGNVSNFEITPKGLAVVSDKNDGGSSSVFATKNESEIAFLSAATGEDVWEKAPKTKGYVQHFYVMDDGILFGIQQGGINKISFDGNPLFKKPLKTGGNIHTMALTKQGVIYITDEDANIINLKTGESIWSKPIKYKKAKSVASTYDKANNRYLISTGDEMIAIDENSGEISTLAKYKFEEKENPTSLEVRDNGLFLSSDQNLMLLDFDGKEKFQEYYKSPGKSTFAKIALGIVAVASVAMSSAAAYQAGANKNTIGSYNSYGADMKRKQDMFSDIGSISFNEMAKRFKATAATKDAQFILTKLDDGVGLVKVSKDTGKVDKQIVLNDKKPEYKIDEFEGFLYYKANKNIINAYDLNK